jgi:uncharacterized protein YjeT (DUF2065 family)
MRDLWTALALVLVIEGVLYALFPEQMKRLLVQMLGVPQPVMRGVGLAAVFIGVGCVWLLRGP